MKRTVGKPALFVALALIAAVSLRAALKSGGKFFDDFWSELFWLSLGIIATTFVLEQILSHNQEVLRRNEDAFAFRTSTGWLMGLLFKMSEPAQNLSDDLAASALSGNREFAESAERANRMISATTAVEPDVYHQHYLDLSSGLRGLAQSYIRLFSSSREEMLQNYRQLEDLASRWNYSDSLSVSFSRYTASLRADDPVRISREAETESNRLEALNVLKDTGRVLSQLACKAATGKGMRAVS
ncbi:MAG: hypothetical protein ACHP8B_08735 [Terriglobales bacterium]